MKTIITPKKNWLKIDIKELIEYRDLFYFLAWRDIKVRYKQTAIGVLWAFFVPVVTMIVFTIFFGTFVGIDSDQTPYPIFVYSGLILWNFFSQSVGAVSGSMVANQEIVKKIYFPKLILPAASILVVLVDFLIASIILVGLMIYYQLMPQLISLAIVPLALFTTYCAALGLGLFLSAVNVKYRDVVYVVPFFIQLLFFLSPVIYPSTIVGERWQWLLNLNPMSGVIENIRAGLFGTTLVQWESMVIGFAISLLLLLGGLLFFRKTEQYFADII